MGAIGVILIASFAIDRIVTREQANVEDAGNEQASDAAGDKAQTGGIAPKSARV